MAITSGFFNSVSGDRLYNAEQMTLYFEGLVGDGIYENIGDKFQVTAGEGMNVTVGTGRALIKTHWLKNDAALSLSIDAASAQYNRYDAVILRYDLTARTVSVVVKKGTETSGVPNMPNLSRTSELFEMCLAVVKVMKNTTAITQAMIVDMRSSALCGWVTGLINQVDTSTLYAQWQSAYEQYYAQTTAAINAFFSEKQAQFETWFESLTQDLRVDTTLKSYKSSVTVSGSVSEVDVWIEEYDSLNDLMFAYINGVYIIQGVDYTIYGTGEEAKIILSKPLSGTNTVSFVVIKPVIGENSRGGVTVGQAGGEATARFGLQGFAEREDI